METKPYTGPCVTLGIGGSLSCGFELGQVVLWLQNYFCKAFLYLVSKPFSLLKSLPFLPSLALKDRLASFYYTAVDRERRRGRRWSRSSN